MSRLSVLAIVIDLVLLVHAVADAILPVTTTTEVVAAAAMIVVALVTTMTTAVALHHATLMPIGDTTIVIVAMGVLLAEVHLHHAATMVMVRHVVATTILMAPREGMTEVTT